MCFYIGLCWKEGGRTVSIRDTQSEVISFGSDGELDGSEGADGELSAVPDGGGAAAGSDVVVVGAPGAV